MIRVCLVLILTAGGPAWACGSNAGSTFCADGWVTQPVEPRRQAADADAMSGDGGQGDPAFFGDQGVYVEGAVVLDDPPLDEEGEL